MAVISLGILGNDMLEVSINGQHVDALVSRLPDNRLTQLTMLWPTAFLTGLVEAIKKSGNDTLHNQPHRKRVLNTDAVQVLLDIRKGQCKLDGPFEPHNQSTLAKARSGCETNQGTYPKEYKEVGRILEALETFNLIERAPANKTKSRNLELSASGEAAIQAGLGGARELLTEILSYGVDQ